jgi:hypothetical protein
LWSEIRPCTSQTAAGVVCNDPTLEPEERIQMLLDPTGENEKDDGLS